MIIDAHVHLDFRNIKEKRIAVERFYSEILEAELDKVILLPIEKFGLTNKDVLSICQENKKVIGFATVNPKDKDCLNNLEVLIKEKGLRGLKLHPRLQDFDLKHKNVIPVIRKVAVLNVPVLIDCLPYGKFDSQYLPLYFDYIAKAAPKAKIIMAHMGGHRLFDALMVAKSNPNIYLDLSRTLLYFRGSSIEKDIGFVTKSIGADRVIYGSDYPDWPLKQALSLSLEVLNSYNLRSQDFDWVMGNTIRSIL